MLFVFLLPFLTLSAHAQTNYQQILSFGPSLASGSSPRGQLLDGGDGFLYGTTYSGGLSNRGTVFRTARNGSSYAVLWNFSTNYFPYAGLVKGGDGALYGTTSAGGRLGGGVVFKINQDGSGFSVLHDFDLNGSDGVAPIGTLCIGTNSLLYGTTSGGGTGNMGTLFEINTNGTLFSVLHTFTGLTNGVDGSFPVGGLLQAKDGLLYGTTQTGGTNDLGTVFRLNSNDSSYSIVYQFGATPGDGHVPSGTLVQAPDGFLYGTTTYGGTNDLGTVFRLGTNGNSYAVLKIFLGSADGARPLAGLTLSLSGTVLYGTTRYGGPNDTGVAFAIRADGSEFGVLHAFTAANGDGGQPIAGLLLENDGSLYGACYYGGDYSASGVTGTLFRLSATAPHVLVTAISIEPAGVILNFSGGFPGQLYQIEASPTLAPGSWQEIGSSIAWIDGSFTFTDSGGASQPARFYRAFGP